jgi:hypothetical protein
MYTEINFEPDDPEIIEYFEEMDKALNGLPYDITVMRKWYSEPVRIDANDESGDYIWTVLVTDDQYNYRKNTQGKIDKTFKKLDKKFKKKKNQPTDPDEPQHVWGPLGKVRHAPEERDEQGEDE